MNRFIAWTKDLDEHYKISFVSISILIIADVLPSIYTKNFIWFSKSGALLVAYGIYILWRDIKGTVDNTLKILNIEASKKLGSKSEEFTNLIGNIRNKNKKLYNFIELIILTTGTIINGYGDLINFLYN